VQVTVKFGKRVFSNTIVAIYPRRWDNKDSQYYRKLSGSHVLWSSSSTITVLLRDLLG